jgi:hypothetical protein
MIIVCAVLLLLLSGYTFLRGASRAALTS